MHAYLLIGTNQNTLEEKARNIAVDAKSKLLEYSIAKIDDVRSLNNYISLSILEPTTIYIKDVEKSSIEALNAFLKNLEEPQNNLLFILTARSIHQVLPTIVSRCQVVRVSGQKEEVDYSIQKKFILAKQNQKLALIDKIKKKEEALVFLYNLLVFTHQLLIRNNIVKKNSLSKFSTTVEESIQRIKANGNISLQLTNLVVNTENIDTSNLEIDEV